MQKSKSLLKQPLVDFSELSKRCSSALNRQGVYDLSDLTKLTKRDLLYIDGFGNKCLTEVERL